MEEQPSRKRTWIIIALIILVLFLLAVFIDLGDVLDTLRGVNLELMALGSIILMGGMILITVRLQYLLGKEVGFLKVLNADGISYLVRMFTPIFLPLLRVATFYSDNPAHRFPSHSSYDRLSNVSFWQLISGFSFYTRPGIPGYCDRLSINIL